MSTTGRTTALREHLPLVLVGLPGAGKTTVARLLARELRTVSVDLDAEIRRRARMSVPAIFEAEGEEGFRDRETSALRSLLTGAATTAGVISLGGGAVLRPANRDMLTGHTVVHLSVTPATAAARVGDGGGRPLMAGPQAPAPQDAGDLAVRSRMEQLAAQRSDLYAQVATLTVVADDRTPEAVAEEVLRRLERPAPARESAAPAALAAGPDGLVTVSVGGARPYDVVIGRGLESCVTEAVVAAPGHGAGGVAIVHADVLDERARALEAALSAGGMRVTRVVVPGGEAAKCTAVLDRVWRTLGAFRMGRDGCVVALGGGAATDLAGFAAATWLRGVSVVQVPTTLLAMVDAAVGGKTGIDTAAGKNLVGAFHPPAAVVCDLETLSTLGDEDLRAGLGEVVKCGLIADPAILDLVLTSPPADLLSPHCAVLAELVTRSVAVKADVVSEDLTEAGSREILNYGHTYAHAIETVTGYVWRHGEAVAVGCVFAAEVAHRSGRIDADLLLTHRRALAAAGLPVSFPEGVGRYEELAEVMLSDKKVRSGRIRMVLLNGLAQPVWGVEPREAVLREAHAAVTSDGTPKP
ncbi:3-dehydroquinate synthase [Actinomyces respiraculi]|uniref:3-dehydroquinate synthase n=1 Tax=Actinomyces respiraculi TaxID=2744574 RepID=UPI0014201AAD|nr:3-dehydroquinate synthase [Actinomyces respiraculi]